MPRGLWRETNSEEKSLLPFFFIDAPVPLAESHLVAKPLYQRRDLFSEQGSEPRNRIEDDYFEPKVTALTASTLALSIGRRVINLNKLILKLDPCDEDDALFLDDIIFIGIDILGFGIGFLVFFK